MADLGRRVCRLHLAALERRFGDQVARRFRADHAQLLMRKPPLGVPIRLGCACNVRRCWRSCLLMTGGYGLVTAAASR